MTATHVPVFVCSLDCEICMDDVARIPGGFPFIVASTSHQQIRAFKNPQPNEDAAGKRKESTPKRFLRVYKRVAFEEGPAWLRALLAVVHVTLLAPIAVGVLVIPIALVVAPFIALEQTTQWIDLSWEHRGECEVHLAHEAFTLATVDLVFRTEDGGFTLTIPEVFFSPGDAVTGPEYSAYPGPLLRREVDGTEWELELPDSELPRTCVIFEQDTGGVAEAGCVYERDRLVILMDDGSTLDLRLEPVEEPLPWEDYPAEYAYPAEQGEECAERHGPAAPA